MSDGVQTAEIIMYAMIAAFILLRLRSVLGRRTGREPPPTGKRNGFADGNDRAGADDAGAAGAEGEGQSRVAALIDALPMASQETIREIYRRDRSFDLEAFLGGAQSAYRMILEGFWAGSTDDIRPFLSDEVAKQFGDAIDQRQADGHTVENRLLETEKTSILTANIEAGLDEGSDGDNVEIIVQFESDIVAVTRDSDGQVVEGDVTDTVHVTDIWTFARGLNSVDPNWTLVETRAG